jgi:hypothetical protein
MILPIKIILKNKNKKIGWGGDIFINQVVVTTILSLFLMKFELGTLKVTKLNSYH